jgi:L-rhamnose isomerase
MSYEQAKERYAAIGVDTEKAIEKLKEAEIALHCWQGDDVRGFDTDPSKPLTGGIQTTGNYPGRARTPEELMADIDEVLKLIPGKAKMNLHASYAIFDDDGSGQQAQGTDMNGRVFNVGDNVIYMNERYIVTRIQSNGTITICQEEIYRHSDHPTMIETTGNKIIS